MMMSMTTMNEIFIRLFVRPSYLPFLTQSFLRQSRNAIGIRGLIRGRLVDLRVSIRSGVRGCSEVEGDRCQYY